MWAAYSRMFHYSTYILCNSRELTFLMWHMTSYFYYKGSFPDAEGSLKQNRKKNHRFSVEIHAGNLWKKLWRCRDFANFRPVPQPLSDSGLTQSVRGLAILRLSPATMMSTLSICWVVYMLGCALYFHTSNCFFHKVNNFFYLFSLPFHLSQLKWFRVSLFMTPSRQFVQDSPLSLLHQTHQTKAPLVCTT